METVTAQEIKSFQKKRSRQFQRCRFQLIMVIISIFLTLGPVPQTCASDSIRIASILSFNADGDPIKNVVIMKITHGQPAYLGYVQPVHLRPARAADNVIIQPNRTKSVGN